MFENISHCEKSDTGLLRHDNEDSFLVVDGASNRYDPLESGMLFVVADGLGGHAAGEIASQMACEEVASGYYGNADPCDAPAEGGDLNLRKLERALWSAHRRLIEAAKSKEEYHGMGTTLSALLLVHDRACMAHVGDSRIYRLRNHTCKRLTVDHTKNQTLIDTGHIHPEGETNLYYGRIITQALGGYDDLATVFTRVEEVRPQDRFLLCTDGLHDLVTDGEIQKILTDNDSAQAACDALIQTAINRGGPDNITVIVVSV